MPQTVSWRPAYSSWRRTFANSPAAWTGAGAGSSATASRRGGEQSTHFDRGRPRPCSTGRSAPQLVHCLAISRSTPTGPARRHRDADCSGGAQRPRSHTNAHHRPTAESGDRWLAPLVIAHPTADRSVANRCGTATHHVERPRPGRRTPRTATHCAGDAERTSPGPSRERSQGQRRAASPHTPGRTNESTSAGADHHRPQPVGTAPHTWGTEASVESGDRLGTSGTSPGPPGASRYRATSFRRNRHMGYQGDVASRPPRRSGDPAPGMRGLLPEVIKPRDDHERKTITPCMQTPTANGVLARPATRRPRPPTPIASMSRASAWRVAAWCW